MKPRRPGVPARASSQSPTLNTQYQGRHDVKWGPTAAVAAATLISGYTAVLGANALIRRREDLDPDSIERPGSMFYLRGIGMHVVERGSGPALVMIHGFGGSAYSFRYQLRDLADQFRVIAVDLPGFGYSDRPTDADLSFTAHAERLREFLDRMGIERAVVAGHSMGGTIAMRLAAAYPERVERLILASSSPPDQQYRLPLYPVIRPLLPIGLAALLGSERRLRRMTERIVYDPATISDTVWREFWRPLRIRGYSASLQKMGHDVRQDVPLAPAAVATRTLLLWGEADESIPLSVAHRLHAEMPDARLEVVARAGHLLLEEQPDACNQSIRRFLAMPTGAATAARP